MQAERTEMSSIPGLTALHAQLDGVAAVLKEAGARIDAAKIAAQAAETEATLAQKRVEQVRESDPGPADNPDRVLTLREAAELSSLSVWTLGRHHRDKFLKLSERRYGMRLRDVLALGSK
jgi:hypothetical protein